MNTNLASHPTLGFPRALALAVPLLVLGAALALGPRSPAARAADGPVVELEEKSKYSKIRITREKNVRTLGFVQDSGEVITESRVDLDKPHELQITYTRYMFTSYLFRSKPERVLLVGLGGGAMVHFLKHHDANVKIDVVEIDPAIVKIADKFFGVRGGGNVNIITQDAFEFLKKTEDRYDVVYMDAFLKPSADTDASGVPLHLKTIQFYKDIQKKLTAEGMVLYNVHPTEKSQDDIKNIRTAFPQTYVFRIPSLNGFVVAGSLKKERASLADLRGAGEELDRRFKTSWSFRDMVERVAPE